MVPVSNPKSIDQLVPLEIILLAVAPVMMVLIPWDFGPDSTIYREFMRQSKLTVTAIEFLFVLLAMGNGFRPLAALVSLPPFAKLGFGMLAIGALWSTMFAAIQPAAAYIGIIKFCAHFLFGLAIFHRVSQWTIPQRELVWPAIGLGVIGFCVMWGINVLFYAPAGNDWARLVPTLTNVRWAGLYAFAIFCTGVGFIRIDLKGQIHLRCYSCALFCASIGIALAFWTGTRAALAAMLIAAMFLLLLFPSRRPLLMFIITSSLIGFAVAAAMPTPHPFYGIGRIVGSLAPVIDGQSISSGRWQIWLDMLDKITMKPVMGWGIDQFRYSFPEGVQSIRHPHNGLMQLVFSSGLWGMFAAALITGQFIKRVPGKLVHPYQFAAVTYVLGMCAYGLADGPFYFTYPVMNFLVAVACVIAPMPLATASDMSH
jgi:O-antigen ligase